MHAIQFQFARLQRPHTGQHFQQLTLPISRHPGDAHDLTLTHGKVDLIEPRNAQRVAHHQALRAQGCGTRRCIATLDTAHVHFASHHGLCQTFDGRLVNGHFGNHPPLAHHGHFVAQPQDLFQLMRNQQDGGALLAQAAQHAKQLFGFLGCEDCGGFVQNQHLGPTVQGFEDFQPLAISHRQIRHQGIQAHMQPGRLHQGLQPLADLVIGTAQQPVRLGPQHHVFQRGQGVHQHEVLVDHAHAQGDGIVGIADTGLAAQHLDTTRVSLVEAVQHRHQRALARPVLAHDAMHRAHANAQVDIVIGRNCAKPLADTGHADRPGRMHGRRAHQYLQALSAM